MDIQRLRNLTTGRLHTEMNHIYQDLEAISGEHGLMTYMLPRMLTAITPWLKKHVIDQRFWNGEYDVTHTGEYTLPIPSEADQKAMLSCYMKQPCPLKDKSAIILSTLMSKLLTEVLQDKD